MDNLNLDQQITNEIEYNMANPPIELGVESGEVCNRNGCAGVISETDSETSCSCHINPPCSHCTTDRHWCPECGWSAEEDREGSIYSPSQKEKYEWGKRMEEFEDERNKFYAMYRGEMPIDKLRFRHESHTHFTQQWLGVFPAGTETKESILPHVKGTFGGRFDNWDDKRGAFKYTAYTD